jgi:hypothetical protein
MRLRDGLSQPRACASAAIVFAHLERLFLALKGSPFFAIFAGVLCVLCGQRL